MGSNDDNHEKQEHGTTDQYNVSRISEKNVTTEDIIGRDAEQIRNIPWEVFTAPSIIDQTAELEKKVERGEADDIDDPEELAEETIEDGENAGEFNLTPPEKRLAVSILTSVFTAILTGDPISAITIGSATHIAYNDILEARNKKREKRDEDSAS